MGIVNTLAQFFSAEPRAQRAMLEQRATAGAAIVPWTAGKAQYLPRTVDTYDAEAYRKVALIFRAVQYVADAAATAPVKAYQMIDGEPDELPDHPIRQLFTRPNGSMGEARFMSFVTMVMSVSGFCLIEKERDGFGNVIGLWPLRSDWARPIPRQQRAPDWEYRIPGEQSARILKAENVIPITYADTPTNDYTGIGPLEILLRETSVTNSLTDFLKVFMDRGALPLYAIIPQDEGPASAQWKKQETKDAFMAAWRQRYGGLHNAADPLPMVGVKDIKRIGMDFNELAYKDLNDLQDARIASAFGIPPILLGAQVGLDKATYSNYEQARRSFYEDTMTPLWARLDDAFSRHLLNDRDFRSDIQLQFDTSVVPALQDDTDAAVENAVKLYTAAIVSRHQAQRIAGVDAHGPDVFLQSFGQIEVPAEATQATPLPQPTATVTPLDDGAEDDERALAIAPGVPVAPDVFHARFVTRDGRTYVNERALTPEQRATADRIAATNKQQIIRLAALAEPVIRRFFRQQRDRIVEIAVRDNRHAIETRAIEQIDWFAEDEALREALEAWWHNVSEVAFADIGAVLGADLTWSVSNPYLQDLFNMLGYRVRDINETTRKAVETIVRESLIDGTTIPDLADALSDVVEEVYRGRAESIARTESQLGYNSASQRAYQASGHVSRVRMHDGVDCESDAGSDGLTCPQRNGLVVNVTDMGRHIEAEHPRGTLAFSPILDTPLGSV